MTEQDKIIAKIKEAAYENVNRKFEVERKLIENRINNELLDVEKCLQFVQNKMVFKIINEKEYKLATEDMLFEDYTKEPKYGWNKGLKFSNPKSKPWEPLFTVNGESYYDMRYIIRHYEESFEYYNRRLNELSDKFNEIKEGTEQLKRQEPRIKKLIEQYQQVEINESFLEKKTDNGPWDGDDYED